LSKTSVVVAGISVCVTEGPATAVGLGSGDGVIVPSSAFFPPLAASLRVACIGAYSFERRPITLITIPEMPIFFVQHAFRIAIHFHRFHLRMIHNCAVLNSVHSLVRISNQSQFLETWKFFVHYTFRIANHFH
jgi:hypothetical protein